MKIDFENLECQSYKLEEITDKMKLDCVQPLTEDMMELCLQLTLNEKDFNLKFEEFEKEDDVDKKLPPLYKTIKRRIDVGFQFKMSNTAIMFLAFIAETPGKAVMYLMMIQNIYKKCEFFHDKVFNMELMCKNVFPMGTISDVKMHAYWHLQKYTPINQQSEKNMVDNPSVFAKSILLP